MAERGGGLLQSGRVVVSRQLDLVRASIISPNLPPSRISLSPSPAFLPLGPPPPPSIPVYASQTDFIYGFLILQRFECTSAVDGVC
jgi:hypothetical protein